MNITSGLTKTNSINASELITRKRREETLTNSLKECKEELQFTSKELPPKLVLAIVEWVMSGRPENAAKLQAITDDDFNAAIQVLKKKLRDDSEKNAIFCDLLQDSDMRASLMKGINDYNANPSSKFCIDEFSMPSSPKVKEKFPNDVTNPHKKFISVELGAIHPEDLEYLSQLNKSTLRIQVTGSCGYEDQQILLNTLLKNLAANTSLHEIHLDVSQCDLSHEELDNITNLQTLKSLNISYNNLANFEIKNFKALTNLTWLNVSNCGINDQAVRDLENCTNLKSVKIGSILFFQIEASLGDDNKLPELTRYVNFTSEGNTFGSDEIERLKLMSKLKQM